MSHKGIDALAKYLSAIYDQRNRKSATDQRAVNYPKSVGDFAQSYMTYDVSTVVGEFGYASDFVTYADSFAPIMFTNDASASYATASSPSKSAEHSILARQVIGGNFPTNLLINPDFEIGIVSGVSGWTQVTAGLGSGSDTYDYTNFTVGSRSLSLAKSPTGQRAWSQTISNVVNLWGKCLTLEIDKYLVSESVTAYNGQAKLEAFDSAGSSVGVLITAVFEAVDASFVTYKTVSSPVPPETNYLVFTFGAYANSAASGTMTIKYDNIRLYEYIPSVPSMFFGRDTIGKESFHTGLIRSFDMFARTPVSSSMGDSSDFRSWTSARGTWGTNILMNSTKDMRYYSYVSTSSGVDDIAYIELGETNNLVVSSLFRVNSTSAVSAGIVVKYSDLNNYVILRVANNNTLRISSVVGGVVTNTDASTTFTPVAGKDYQIIAVLDGPKNITGYLLGENSHTNLPMTVTISNDNHTGTKHGLAGNNTPSTNLFLNFIVSDVFWRNLSTTTTAPLLNFNLFDDSYVKSGTPSGSNMSACYIDLEGSPESVIYRANISSLPTSTDTAGVLFRVKDKNNYWRITVASSGNTYSVIPTINGIDTYNIVTDLKKVAESTIYIQSDPDGFFISTGDSYFEEIMLDKPLGYYRLNDTPSTYAESLVSRRLSSDTDDVRRVDASLFDSTDLTIGSAAGANSVATRYDYVGVPYRSLINSASVVFTPNATLSGTNVTARISANTNASSAKIAVIGTWDAFTKTTSVVDWAGIGTWTNATTAAVTTTPSLTTIIQELVDMQDWTPASHVHLLFENRGSSNTATRKAWGVSAGLNNSPDVAPLLNIGFTAPKNIKDFSGNNNHGTYPSNISFLAVTSGALATDADRGINNTSISAYNGIISSIYNVPLGQAARTLECWFNPSASTATTATGVTGGMFCGYPNNNVSAAAADWFFLAYSSDGAQKFEVNVDNAVYRSTSTFVTGSWYHLAATYDASTVKLYVNGVQEISQAVTLATTLASGTVLNNFCVFGSPNTLNKVRNGSIDEVSIYNKSLSYGRIVAHYNAGKSHPLEMGQGKYRFDSTLFGNSTGFGLYFKGSTGKIKYPKVTHLKFDGSYKELASYNNQTRLA